MAEGMVRRLFWVDTRDMLADCLTKGGIDRELLRSVSNKCKYLAKRDSAMHVKHGVGSGGYGGGSVTNSGQPSKEEDPE